MEKLSTTEIQSWIDEIDVEIQHIRNTDLRTDSDIYTYYSSIERDTLDKRKSFLYTILQERQMQEWNL